MHPSGVRVQVGSRTCEKVNERLAHTSTERLDKVGWFKITLRLASGSQPSR